MTTSSPSPTATPVRMSAERILKLRRWQVRCVAIGTFGAMTLLAGAVVGWKWLFFTGAFAFALALLAIFALGIAAWRSKP